MKSYNYVLHNDVHGIMYTQHGYGTLQCARMHNVYEEYIETMAIPIDVLIFVILHCIT